MVFMRTTCQLLALIATLGGCSTASSLALCDGSEEARTALAAALVEDGGPQSRAAGRTLIARIDAGCVP